MTHCLRQLTNLLLLTAVAGASGCAGGQTGGEDVPGLLCSEQRTPLELGQVSPLGFSAADVLSFTEGEHFTTIEWQPIDVPYAPESGTQQLTFSIENLGRARYVDRSGDSCCFAAVQVDVRVTLETSGGALGESFVTVLEARRADAASLYASIEPPLGGSLSFDQQALGIERLIRLELYAHFDAANFGGGLSAGFQSDSGADQPDRSDGVAGFRSLKIASWGAISSAAPVCGL
jgi:hypothetical protein